MTCYAHEALADVARQLADRARDKDERRIFGALATLWAAVIDRQQIPKMHALRVEIREALQRAAQREPAGPGRAAIEELLRYHQPSGFRDHDTPLIVSVHHINQQLRASRAATPANPGGDHVNRSAARAPEMQQAAARPQRVAATQPGLL